MPASKSIIVSTQSASTGTKMQYDCVVSSAFSPPSGLPRSKVDKLARLNEVLLYKSVSVKNRFEEGYWIPANQKWWKSEFGSDYRDVQNNAVEMRMLEFQPNKQGEKKSYSSDKSKSPKAKRTFCASCRLTHPYRSISYKLWPLSRKPRTKSSPSTKLSQACQTLAEYLQYMAVDPSVATNTPGALLACFFNRGFHRPVEDKYGRFHSTLTALPKTIRATLALKNNGTHMINETSVTSGNRRMLLVASGDSCKQETAGPVMATHGKEAVAGRMSLMKQTRLEGYSPHQAGVVPMELSLPNFALLDIKNCIAICLSIHCLKESQAPDVDHWVNTAEAGNIYETIQSWLHKNYCQPYWYEFKGKKYKTEPSTWTRERVKKQFMITVYGDSPEHPIWSAIVALWPTVAQIMTKIKTPKYEKLAHECQKIESSIVIQEACPRLIERLPGVPFGTIHDCIAIPAKYSEIAKQELIKAFQRHGVTPKIASSLDHDD
jgi:hypothetical protein